MNENKGTMTEDIIEIISDKAKQAIKLTAEELRGERVKAARS